MHLSPARIAPVIGLLAVCLATHHAHATLIGEDVTVATSPVSSWANAKGPFTGTVGPGAEFSFDISSETFRVWTVTMDFDADSLRITNQRSGGLSTPSGLEYYISDVSWAGMPGMTIGSLDLELNTTDSTVQLLLTGPDSFTVRVDNASVFNSAEELLIRINPASSTAAVPEPAAATLGVISLAGIALSATRRRSRCVN